MDTSFHYKKSLGQHFLNSPLVPEWLCAAGNVDAADTVVEIGPGTGVLTRALLERGATVHAIETDRRALLVLADTFAPELHEQTLILHQSDARTLSLSSLGLVDHQFKVIANIPYYLTGHLLRSCVEHPVQPSDLIFLVQKEVAKRAAAKLPPATGAKASLLSLSLQVYGDVFIFKAVSRGHFTPPPAVDSAILAVRNISRVAFADHTEATFFTVIRAGFAAKRKQIFHNFKHAFGPECAEHLCSSAQIKPSARAEDLSLADWQNLARAYTGKCQ